MNRFYLDYETAPDTPFIWWPSEDGDPKEAKETVEAASVQWREQLPRARRDSIKTPTYVMTLNRYPNWPFI